MEIYFGKHGAFQTTQIRSVSTPLFYCLLLPSLTYKLYQYWIVLDVLDLARSYKDDFLAPVLWNISRNKSPSTMIPTS